MKRVLVTYASKHGATAEIAETLHAGSSLATASVVTSGLHVDTPPGLDTTVCPSPGTRARTRPVALAANASGTLDSWLLTRQAPSLRMQW